MRKKVFIFWVLLIAVGFFRFWQSFGVVSIPIGDCLKQVVVGKGNIIEEPERKESGQILVIRANSLMIASTSVSCASDLSVRVKTKLYPRFSFGDSVRFKGKLLEPINFDSSIANGSSRSFDYKGYLAKDEIFYEMKSAVVEVDTRLSKDPAIKQQSDFENNNNLFGTIKNFFTVIIDNIISKLYSFKLAFVKSLESNLGEPHAALASGLIVGEKSALGKKLLEDFRIVGLIHIVVLSGYNITIVADVMRRFLVFLPRVWGIFIGGFGMAMFGILVGGRATVVRSCFMASIALSADLIRRDYSVIRALFFVGLLMLIQNPLILLHDPSFQLSFLATLGLIVLASPIEKRLTFVTEKFSIRGIVASTIATQVFVSPYILYMMGQISIIGMVVNILVLPFIPLTMLLGSLAGIIGIFNLSLAQPLAWCSHLLLSYELFMVEHFARFPFASAHIDIFSFWWVAGFYVVFAGVWWGMGLKKK